ncbi:helix-turn-helix domain-containing protein [Clostridium tetanomorphum]|uniref:Helix-turn-helix transcriptional regulator n=1 Tax=Clostridium tetanomorphum TaxID=1553 RepID=A0A923EE23_CLOTT|nr:AraC family transcriptional regulator [Clostridium tetanomorphum]MBC2399140.1 helix-turn-helix transcriptional regulator [Clostridium tetanomorphum]NRZ97984.1 AraC-like DNA-binding protein [Clostridium tetanomorphum]
MEQYRIYNSDKKNCVLCHELNNLYALGQTDHWISVESDQVEGKYRRISPSKDIEIVYCDMVTQKDVKLIGNAPKKCYEFSFPILQKCQLIRKNDQLDVNSYEGIFRKTGQEELGCLAANTSFKGITIRFNEAFLCPLLESCPNIESIIYHELNCQKQLLSEEEKMCIKQIMLTPSCMATKECYIKSKVLELLSLRFNSILTKSKELEDYASSDYNSLVLAREIVEENLVNPPTIPELSRLVTMNECKLKKGFKQLTGMTIRKYVITKRMEKAKELLITTNKPIESIAVEIGYKDATHFSSQFRKKYDIYPSKLRF